MKLYKVKIPVIAREPKSIRKDYVLKISFSDLGQCAAVVVKRWRA